MVEVKAMLKEEVLDGQLQEKLKEIAAVVVKEIVRKHIVERVRKEVSHNQLNWAINVPYRIWQLQDQIPQDMREQSAKYQRQLLEVKASLQNS